MKNGLYLVTPINRTRTRCQSGFQRRKFVQYSDKHSFRHKRCHGTCAPYLAHLRQQLTRHSVHCYLRLDLTLSLGDEIRIRLATSRTKRLIFIFRNNIHLVVPHFIIFKYDIRAREKRIHLARDRTKRVIDAIACVEDGDD